MTASSPEPRNRLAQCAAMIEGIAQAYSGQYKEEAVDLLVELFISLHLDLDREAEIALERGNVRIVEAIRATFKDAAANVYDVVVAGKGEVTIRFDLHWPRDKQSSTVERVSPENSLKLHNPSG